MRQKVIEFAQSQGYETALRLKNWKGFEVYEPIMKKDEVSYTGLPLLILVKGDEIRMSTPDEALEQLNS